MSGVRPGNARLPGGGLSGLPPDEVRYPGIAHPAGRDSVINRLQRLLQGRVAPGMDLPQVDVVALQPAQRSLKITKQGPARRVDDPLAVPDHESGLCRDHHLVSDPQLAHQPTDDALGVTRAVRRGRVDQGPAGLAEHLEQRMGVLGRCVAAPGHGAEPEPRYPQPAAPDLPSFHGETLTASRIARRRAEEERGDSFRPGATTK